MIMDRLYGGVCYAGIDTDPDLRYPKGAGRVAFSNQQSYIAAISARFVQLQHADIDKRVCMFGFIAMCFSLLFTLLLDLTRAVDEQLLNGSWISISHSECKLKKKQNTVICDTVHTVRQNSSVIVDAICLTE